MNIAPYIAACLIASVPQFVLSAVPDCPFAAADEFTFELRTASAAADDLKAFELSAASDEWSHVLKTTSGRSWLIGKRPLLESFHVATVTLEPHPYAFLGEGPHLMRFNLTPDGAQQLSTISATLLGKSAAFLLNGHLLSPFTFGAKITGGSLQVPAPGCTELQLRRIASRVARS
jgi:hypothetical protein